MGNARNNANIPRRDERYVTAGMSCPLGEIVDLSASGMRIRTQGKPQIAKGQVEQFVLRTTRQKLSVTGCVAWSKRSSLLSKQHELGITFTDNRPAIRQALVKFAKYGFVGGAQNNSSASNEKERVVRKAAVVLEDYYKALGVGRDASDQEIRKAFWSLAKSHHPDNNQDPNAEAKFRRINEAHEILGDAAKRKRYDQLLMAQSNAA